MKSPQEILNKVKRIELKTKWQTQQLFGGEYHSAFKGKGMSFSEVREYSYGDDVRNIDWNVTARVNTPHIKVFEEERELNVIIIADVSSSLYFGLKSHFKIESLIEVAAAVAFSAVRNQDKVGAILCNEKVEKYISPRKGRQHMLKIITDLVRHEPGRQRCRLQEALEYLYHVEKKRSIIFILSDFMTDGYFSALQVLSNKHDVIGIKIYDEYEQNLPQVGLIKCEDIESGNATWIDTDDRLTRENFKRHFDKYDDDFTNNFIQANASTIRISTDEDCYHKLQAFFHNRAKR
jgi:uncharacterized protein (DUF58 family)